MAAYKEYTWPTKHGISCSWIVIFWLYIYHSSIKNCDRNWKLYSNKLSYQPLVSCVVLCLVTELSHSTIYETQDTCLTPIHMITLSNIIFLKFIMSVCHVLYSCLCPCFVDQNTFDIEVLFLPMHITYVFVVLYNVTTLTPFKFSCMIGSVDLVWTWGAKEG